MTTKTTIIMPKDLSDNEFTLCEQLHKQYAEADNNKTNNLLSFITVISFIFAAYGYLYYNYYNKPEDTFLLTAATMLVIFILGIITVISMNYGYTLRRDHVIIERIRKNIFINSYSQIFALPNTTSDNKEISGRIDNFKSSQPYTATGKTLHSFLPDYYLVVSISCILLQFGVSVFSLFALEPDKQMFAMPISIAVRCGLFVLLLFVMYAIMRCFGYCLIIGCFAYATFGLFHPLADNSPYCFYIVLFTLVNISFQLIIYYGYWKKYLSFCKNYDKTEESEK